MTVPVVVVVARSVSLHPPSPLGRLHLYPPLFRPHCIRASPAPSRLRHRSAAERRRHRRAPRRHHSQQLPLPTPSSPAPKRPNRPRPPCSTPRFSSEARRCSFPGARRPQARSTKIGTCSQSVLGQVDACPYCVGRDCGCSRVLELDGRDGGLKGRKQRAHIMWSGAHECGVRRGQEVLERPSDRVFEESTTCKGSLLVSLGAGGWRLGFWVSGCRCQSVDR